MEELTKLVSNINSFIWGMYCLIPLLCGVGIYFTIRLKFIQVRKFGQAVRMLFGDLSLKGKRADKHGMSSFQSVATAIAAQVGTGNLAGAATAIAMGGPGAIFWMWIAAFFGMATIFAEAVLAQVYRTRDDAGHITGGPAYYISKGLGSHKLAVFFSVSIIIALGCIGNMVQSNSIADAFKTAFDVPPLVMGLIIAACGAFVFFGGIGRIAAVTEKMVPLMALLYVIGGLFVVLSNADQIIPAFKMIFVGGYRTIASFGIDRSNPNIEVGFDPYAPVSVSVAKTTGREFRLIVRGAGKDTGFAEVLLSSLPRVERYAEKTFAKMFQSPLPYWEEYQWRDQPVLDDASLAVDPAEVVDITECLDGDRLVWEAPAGEWVVMRTGMRPTGIQNSPAAPEGTGLEVDKMTPAYLQHHFDAFIGEILRRIPAEDRRTFRVVVADSYEKGGQNFTDTFLTDFRERYGYDALPFLPVYDGVVVGSQDISDRFLWDMRRLAADKLAYAHIGGLREIAHKYGLTLWLENYGHWGYPGEFLQYGGQSDEVGGEFWGEGSLGDIENRAASSCAHIYGKRKVSAESYTSAGNDFGRYPAMVKPRGDRFFSEGINNTLLHVYISQPGDELPGMNAWFGTEFNRNNTWFSHIDLFTDYLKRVNYMLQQGLNVADVAYFIGEDAPKMTGVTDPALPRGYQYDYINGEVLLERATVKDGLWTLPHGTQYWILMLPKLETMRPELLAKLQALVREGGVLLGPAPQRSPSLEGYPDADARVRRMAAELWGGVDGKAVKAARYGKGAVLDGMSMKEALAYVQCLPDCEVGADVPVLFGHRDAGDVQIYFLTNQSDARIAFPCTLRVTGSVPEAWDAVTGAIRPLPEFEDDGRRTTLPMVLEPNQSLFVVLRADGAGAAHGDGTANFPTPVRVKTLDGPWTLTFQEGRRGPAEPVVADELKDLRLSDDESVRYFSGSVRYETTFDLRGKEKSGRLYVNTGQVGVMAKVYVNGKYAGGVWTAPYRVDVTDFVRKGKNTLVIDVVNTWVNRLIGDSRLPEDQRGTWTLNNPWRPDSQLQPSGLFNPVVIERMIAR